MRAEFKRFIKTMIAAGAISGALMVFPAYAGSINGSEQSIVSAAQGQFEYNGATYRAKQQYVNQLVSYLSQDSVDLSASQAQSAISQMFGSIQTGVDGGYLEKIGGGDSSSGGPGVSNSLSKENQESEAEDRKQENEKTPETAAEAKTAMEGISQQIQKIADSDQETETQPENLNQPPPTETIPPENVPIEPVKVIPQEVILLETVKSTGVIPGGGVGSMSASGLDTDGLMKGLRFNLKPLWIALAVLAVLMVLLIGLSFFEKLYKHRHHTKLREIVRAGFAFELGSSMLILLAAAGLWLGAVHDTSVYRSLNRTGYYQAIYESLQAETVAQLHFLGIPDRILNDSVSHDRVMLAARQQVENDLNQGDYRVNTVLITNQVKDRVVTYLQENSIDLTKEAGDGLDLVIKDLDEKFTSLIQWPFSSWWVKLRREFMGIAKVVIPVGFLLLVFSHVALIGLHHYKHRGVRQCGAGVLGASAVLLLLYGAAGFSRWKTAVDISPPYMKEFFISYIGNMIITGLLVGGIGVLLAAGYFLLSKAVREGVKG